MDRQEQDRGGTNRRGFLQLAGIGSVAAAGAAIVKPDDAKATTATTASPGTYRETEHVRTYYDLARF